MNMGYSIFLHKSNEIIVPGNKLEETFFQLSQNVTEYQENK